MSFVILGIGILALVAAVIIVVNDRLKVKRLLNCLEDMLNRAMKGDFSASSFDESRFSKLESELAEYLSSSSHSAQNVRNEKNKLNQLISDISHQTKTPVANLVLYGELLEGTELTDEQKSNVAAMRNQTEKLRFLIDSLVKLSRLESGIISLERQKTEVYPLLENIREQLKEKAAKKGIGLVLCKTDAVADIDPKWTQEAIFNIVDNAVKYTDKGSVTISVTEFDLFVKVDVTDTGPGIPEDEQPKIFGRFYRSAAVKSEEGVGIGLHLAREIISGEGGYIKVTSPNRDSGVGNVEQAGSALGATLPDSKGATFSVFLPR